MNETLLLYSMISFFCGINTGSAMTCLGERTAAGRSWIRGRSRCDFCDHLLHGSDLIPVASFLIHHGRCRYCGKKISFRYFRTELLSGIVFVLIYRKVRSFDFDLLLQWMLCSTLLALSITDLDAYRIPDGYVVFLIVLWIIRVIYDGFFLRLTGEMILHDLLGGLLPSTGILMLAWVMERLLKKETLGGGDIKLLFALGLHVGFLKNILVLITSSIIGLLMVFLMKKEKIPFGPCISIGMVLVMLAGDEMISWYLKLLM